MSELSRREKILLEEYKLCQQKAQGSEGPIWLTSSIIGLGSIGALLVIATQNHQIDPNVVLGAGLFVNLVAWFWYKMAGRYWSIQHTALMRLHHVEKELKEIYLDRYIKRRDARAIPHLCTRQTDLWEKECSKYKIPARYECEVDAVKGYVRFGTQFWSKCILCLNALAWMLYICWRCWFAEVGSPVGTKIKLLTVIAGLGFLAVFVLSYLCLILKQKFESDRLKEE